MGESSSKTREIDLGEDFGDVVVKANGAQVTIDANGSIYGLPAAANDTAGKATPEIGDIERDGDHKGEIYGGIYPADNKPIWFLAAPKSMDHFNAASWATEQGGALPTTKQGDYLTTLKDKGGAFTELFNRGSSFPAGYVWLAEPRTIFSYGAWIQSDLMMADNFSRVSRFSADARRVNAREQAIQTVAKTVLGCDLTY